MRTHDDSISTRIWVFVSALVLVVAVGIVGFTITRESGDDAAGRVEVLTRPQVERDLSASARTGTDAAVGSSATTDGTTTRRDTPPTPSAIGTSVVTAPESTTVRTVTTPVPTPTEPVTYDDAEALFHARDYAGAADAFAAYCDDRPDNPWGRYMLGLASWKAGRLEDAVNAFGTALELDPEHVKSGVNLARVHLELGEPREALGRIEQVLTVEPDRVDAIRVLGRCRHELGEADASIDAYRRALGIDPTDVWSLNNLGLVLIQRERFEDAVFPLALAVSEEPGVAVFRNNLGVALERTGHYQAAFEAYRAALDIDSTYARASESLIRVEPFQEMELVPFDLAGAAEAFLQSLEGGESAALIDEPEQP